MAGLRSALTTSSDSHSPSVWLNFEPFALALSGMMDGQTASLRWQRWQALWFVEDATNATAG